MSKPRDAGSSAIGEPNAFSAAVNTVVEFRLAAIRGERLPQRTPPTFVASRCLPVARAMGQSGAASGTGGRLGPSDTHEQDESDLDLDELECTLANLIYSGYVKGYIAHEKRVLVLSKASPFPTARLSQPPNTVF